jgi:hypothetical protein
VSDRASRASVAFAGTRCLARGSLAEVALAVKAASEDHAIVFDEATCNVVDLDLRGTPDEILARLRDRPAGGEEAPRPDAGPPPSRRGRGRPKLGVVSREVTLLPRHWEWLAAQPGGASQALRRLVDTARRSDRGATGRRAAREAAYRFISVMAGNLPGFEEATRALFAEDSDRFRDHTSVWPEDVRRFAQERAFGAVDSDGTSD